MRKPPNYKPLFDLLDNDILSEWDDNNHRKAEGVLRVDWDVLDVLILRGKNTMSHPTHCKK